MKNILAMVKCKSAQFLAVGFTLVATGIVTTDSTWFLYKPKAVQSIREKQV